MRLAWLPLLVLVGCARLGAPGYQEIPKEQLVKEVVIEDQGAFPHKETEAVLYVTRGRFFDSYEWDKDKDRLKAYYHLRGFPDARIELSEALQGPDGVRIRYVINSGPELRLMDLSLASGGILMASELKELLSLDTGDRLDRQALDLGKARIRSALASLGYVRAKVDARVIAKKHKASLDIAIEEGKRAYIGDVELLGLEHVRLSVASREVVLKRGELFLPKSVYATQKHLLTTGLFSSVRVLVPGLERGDDTLRVFIQMREAKHRFIESGLGYASSDVSPDRVTTSLSMGHENLWGLAASLLLELGLQREWSSDFWQQTARLAYTEPWLRGMPFTGGISLDYKRRSVGSSEYQSYGATILAGRSWHERASVFARYKYQSRLTDAGEDPSDYLVDEINRPITNSVEGTITLDTRDSFADPHSGQLFRTQLMHAGTFLKGDWSFRKLFVDWSAYRQVGAFVFATRARVGLIRPLSDSPTAPEEERFRAGGSNSVRGFKEEGLGPIDEDGNALGGEELVVANLELRAPIWRHVGLGLFLDMGQVWQTAGAGRLSDLEPAAGLGLRYATVIGPVRADWGVPLKHDGRGTVCLTLGHAF